MLVAILIGATLAGVGGWLWTPDQPLAALEARYLRDPGDYVTVAGVTLHVRDTGPRSAPTVVLLHGFGSSLHTWEPWAQTLSLKYRVVRFDLPGSGLSSPDPLGDYRDARSLQLLSALMDRLDIERATLVGNSMGGRIAWQFAAHHPQRVSALILISPDGFASPGFAYGKQPEIPRLLTLMQYVLPKALLRANLAAAYGDPSHLTDATVTRYYELMLAPGARAAMIARMRQSVLEDPVPLLRRIQAPTLLLWGEKDAMIPFANSADYLTALSCRSLVSFPDLGHVPHEESPSESLAPVLKFLATHRVPGEASSCGPV